LTIPHAGWIFVFTLKGTVPDRMDETMHGSPDDEKRTL